MRATETIEAARRAIEICNACRFCNGYCVVFQVMELRRAFSGADLGYMANLCHNCRNCYYACQYAPPHEFAINLPKHFSQIRVETYEEYAWPRPLAVLFRRNGVIVSVAVALGIAITLILTIGLQASEERFNPHRGPGAFYTIIPWKIMVSVAGTTLGLSLVSLTVSVFSFWRDTDGRVPKANNFQALWTALYDVLTLRNLGGGGHGCNDYGESFSRARRHFHHFMLYGLVLCFASTSIATIYDHFLGWRPPYPLLSMPVVLGIIGGLGMVIGTGGFTWIKIMGDPNPTARNVLGADYALLSLLLSVAASGLLLLAFRETAATSVLLAIHLGIVLSFFLLLPYSKFIHGGYRAAALLRAAMERGAA
jgi:citrate/tricarballylate utilization protein